MQLTMNCAVYIPMKDGETKEQAEDRLIKVLDDAGMYLMSWWGEEIEEVDEA